MKHVSPIAFLLAAPAFCGGFLIESNLSGDVNAIVHPYLYVGAATSLTIRVCLDPGFSEIDLAEPDVIQALATWNAMIHSQSNLTSDIPVDKVGFESVVLHEIGHCAFGLAHPNLGDPATINRNYITNALPGDDGLIGFNVGVDGIPGSSDDLRGDDVNRTWFNKFDNDPFFAIGPPIDTVTYSRDVSDLPSGHLFASNANRLVGAGHSPPILDTEAVMTAGIGSGESRKALQADDFATLQLATTGKDGFAGSGDEYTFVLQYQGRTSESSGCDVIIESTTSPQATLGSCSVDSISIGGSHFRLAGNGIVSIRERSDWYYGSGIFIDGFETGDLSRWSASAP